VGEAKMNEKLRELARQRALERPLRILKAVTAFILIFPLIPFAAAVESYRDNKWIWS
jgi:hypothetical protein